MNDGDGSNDLWCALIEDDLQRDQGAICLFEADNQMRYSSIDNVLSVLTADDVFYQPDINIDVDWNSDLTGTWRTY